MAYPTRFAQPTLVRWSSVFAGAVVALAMLGLLAALWQALGTSSDVTFVADNMEWFIGGSAVFAMFVGGILAGWLSGVGGPGHGMIHGVTVWGLLFIGALLAGIPAAVFAGTGDIFTADGVEVAAEWTIFWSLLVGLGSALVGGLIGGAFPRLSVPVAPGAAEEGVVPHEHRPDGEIRVTDRERRVA